MLYLTAEDNLEDTLKPRFVALNADHSRIKVNPQQLLFDKGGLKWLRHYVEDKKPILVVIDPLFAYVSGEKNLNADNHVREILTELKQIAADYKVAILCLRHVTKSARDKAIYRGSGSIGFTAAARSVLMAGYDTNNKDQFALFHIKPHEARRVNSAQQRMEEANEGPDGVPFHKPPRVGKVKKRIIV